MLKAAAEMTDAETENVPACLTRDNLTSPYFPNTTRGGFAAVAALCAIFLFTSLNRLNHTDLWGHLSFGRWIVEHGSLPASDPFAAAPNDVSVLPYCWLSQVLGYEMWRLGGNDGLILAHAALETLAAGILMLAVWRRGAKGYWPALAGLCFAVLSLPILGTIRPQLFSQVCLALVLLACAELPTSRRPLFWLPIIFALWANLHATMIIGLGVIGVMGIGEMWRAYEAKKQAADVFSDGIVRRFVLAGVLGLIAACLNPHGPMMFVEALTFGRSGAVNVVSEWQAVSEKSKLTAGLLLGSMLIAGITIFSAKGKQPLRWNELAMLALFGVATLGAIRMLVWWAILWPYVIIPMLGLLFQSQSDSEKSADAVPVDEGTSMQTVFAMALIFITLITAPPTHSLLHGRGRGLVKTVSSDTPFHVTDELLRRKLSGTFVAPTDWADYIVWETKDQLKPLVYGHFHLASQTDLIDYGKIMTGIDWLPTARKHHLQYILADRTRYLEEKNGKKFSTLVNALNNNPEVRVVYQDKRCVLAEILPPPKPVEKKPQSEAPASEEPAADNSNAPSDS